MAFAEDLDAFFDTGDFALAATLNGVASGNVIFDRAYLDQLGMVAGASPVALGQAADYVEADVGKTLVIDAVSYTIVKREPLDDGALVLLHLEKP